jgi:hypothetical protein
MTHDDHTGHFFVFLYIKAIILLQNVSGRIGNREQGIGNREKELLRAGKPRPYRV